MLTDLRKHSGALGDLQSEHSPSLSGTTKTVVKAQAVFQAVDKLN